jgi:hypothetical protein
LPSVSQGPPPSTMTPWSRNCGKSVTTAGKSYDSNVAKITVRNRHSTRQGLAIRPAPPHIDGPPVNPNVECRALTPRPPTRARSIPVMASSAALNLLVSICPGADTNPPYASSSAQ